jgi:type II secretory pathway component GspD/PulD (secretin)
VDQEANAIIANGPTWLVARVQEDLAKLDTRPPEVVFDVVAVECSTTEELFRQLDLTRLLGDFSAGFHTLTGGLELLWLENLPRGWDLLLDSRDSKATVRLSSRGSLRVASGRTSRIFAGQRRFIIVENVSEVEGLTANIEPISTGTTLDLQPRLGAGDEVVLYLELEIRSLRGEDPMTRLPIIGSRQTHQTVRVKDGDTILVTGLTLREVERRDRVIPVLGWLPLIGSVFRLPDHATSNTELAVFLTPHIIRDSVAKQGDNPHG